jgi:predicted RNA binding protein YcfA (HicA-like mRNA interferase family)
MDKYKDYSILFLKGLYGILITDLASLEVVYDLHRNKPVIAPVHHKKNLGMEGRTLPTDMNPLEFFKVMKIFGFKEKRHTKHVILSKENKSVAVACHRGKTMHINMVLKYIKEAGLTKNEFMIGYYGVA